MTTNSDFSQINRFLFNGTAFESAYHFLPSNDLKEYLNHLPPKSAVRVFFHNNEIRLQRIPSNSEGFCVRIGAYLLYLLLKTTPQSMEKEGFDEAIRLHNILMGSQLYFPQQEDILDYWKKPVDDKNAAELYASEQYKDRSEYLIGLIRTFCPDVKTALEIGCNVGRNLYALQNTLDLTVSGIEISEHAVALQKTLFSDFKPKKIYVGAAQALLPTLADASFDLVFSMAVLMHLHPHTPASFWTHIPRVAAYNIITIENESLGSTRNWCRDYRSLFASRAQLIHQEPTRLPHPDFGGYTTRVFKVYAP